jgi:hypothetical protein
VNILQYLLISVNSGQKTTTFLHPVWNKSRQAGHVDIVREIMKFIRL